MSKKIVSFCFVVFCCVGVANAQLLVDIDLGTIGLGNINISGDTATAVSEADYYTLTNPAGNWGNDIVYQFTTTEATLFNMMTTATTGDPDFFLLTSTDVVVDGAGKLMAVDNIANYFLDGGTPDTGAQMVIPAGTYFISATTWHGVDGAKTGLNSTYSATIMIEEFIIPDPPVGAIDLGTLAGAGEAFTIDTVGTGQDTELGYWDSESMLLGTNDDIEPGNLESELAIDGLDAGTYYLAFGLFNTTFGFGFDATSNTFNSGPFVLNHPNGTFNGNINGFEVIFFQFAIGEGSCGFDLGDTNNDGMVDLLDVAPFVDHITNGTFACEADIDGDGTVGLLDVAPFVSLLTGG